MRQASVWYDTCPVCQGRGAIPCHECSGVGQHRDTEHGQSSIQPQYGVAAGMARQQTAVARLCTCAACACEDCGGTGAVSCTACHGHGMRGLPAYAGSYY
jgi:hypothetical protein